MVGRAGAPVAVTDTGILAHGFDQKVAISILIKPNQTGTLVETLAAVEMATRNGCTAVVLHRSGETEDTTLADLAVGASDTQIKTGSLCRSDRVSVATVLG